MARKLGMALVAVLALAGATGLYPATVGLPPAAAAEDRTASCTEGTTTWSVDYSYTVEPTFGPLVDIEALWQVTGGGSPVSADDMTWQIRRDNFPHEWAPNVPETSVTPFQQVEGPLSSFGSTLWSGALSPRLVSPDGTCTIYLAPFADAGPAQIGPKVAVLGDDLVTQLNHSTDNLEQQNWQGYAEGALNDLGLQAEVEGQGPIAAGTSGVPGRRWTDDGSSNALANADSYLGDEFRGLLEHDVDAFVMALGVNDARYIAAGTDPQARQVEVYAKLDTIARDEMRRRTGCMAVVTIPENASSVDPDYAWAALQVNNYFRWYAALYGGNDALEVVDFALEAKDHLHGEPDSWFVGADNIYLNPAGRAAFVDAIARAARRCTDEVVVHGADGTFDGGPMTGLTRTTTGHQVARNPVDDWEVLPGRGWWFPTVLSDGTILVSNVGHYYNPFLYSGTSMAVSAYQPATNDFYTIRIPTDAGVFDRTGQGGEPMGFELGDVRAIDDDTVVFTGASLYGDIYLPDGEILPDPAQGMFPSLGVLTKGANGRWQVAAQWSPSQLHAAASNPVLADKLCPLFWPTAEPRTIRDCLSLQQVEALPHSGDIVVTSYLGPRGRQSGNIAVLDLSPDGAGGFDVDIEEVFEFPEIPDLNSPTGQFMAIAPLEIDADPTSAAGDERFAIKFDAFPAADNPGGVGIGMIELSYDAGAPTSKIEAVSPPVFMGKATSTSGEESLLGANLPVFDKFGNLWIPGSSLYVYAKTANGRRLSNGTCMPPGVTNPLDPTWW